MTPPARSTPIGPQGPATQGLCASSRAPPTGGGPVAPPQTPRAAGDQGRQPVGQPRMPTRQEQLAGGGGARLAQRPAQGATGPAGPWEGMHPGGKSPLAPL